jgi:hypothetical protein
LRAERSNYSTVYGALGFTISSKHKNMRIDVLMY